MHVLHVPLWAWAATIAALGVLLGADLILSTRRRKPAGLAEAAMWTLATVAAAVAFGALVAAAGGGAAAGQFFAGWLTEYSLSLDNLVVFVLLITSSGVPRQYHSRVLLLGILLALLLRGVLIGLGGAALQRFGWVEYLFGAFLLYVAVRMALSRGRTGDARDGAAVRAARRFLPVASRGDGGRLTTRVHGRWHATPLLILVIAIGVTDVFFALDSIPAIFGLTRDPFLVFSANLFALLGLRHLYFLVGGLLGRLVYLPAGLAAILAFIGIKLVSEALHGSGVDNLGPLAVPQVSATVSLMVIAGLLAVTIVASLAASRRRAGQPGPGSTAGQAGAQPSQPPQVHARTTEPTEGTLCPGAGSHRDSSGGGERLADVRQDVPEADLDRLPGCPPGDLDHSLGQAAPADGDPQRDAGEFGVGELHPGPFGPVVDDDLDARRGELLVHRLPGLGRLGVLGLGDGHHDAERRHRGRPDDPALVVVAFDDHSHRTLDPDPVAAHDGVHPLTGRIEHGDAERLGVLVTELEDVPDLDRRQQFQRLAALHTQLPGRDLA
jgi:tellurite resistance protein TerC